MVDVGLGNHGRHGGVRIPRLKLAAAVLLPERHQVRARHITLLRCEKNTGNGATRKPTAPIPACSPAREAPLLPASRSSARSASWDRSRSTSAAAPRPRKRCRAPAPCALGSSETLSAPRLSAPRSPPLRRRECTSSASAREYPPPTCR